MAITDDLETPEATDEDGEVDYETGSLQRDSLPYAYKEEALDLTVTNYLLDGESSDDRGDLYEGRQSISLVDDGDWKTLTIEGSIGVTQETIESVFPGDEWDDPPARLAVVITCPESISRCAEMLTDHTVEEKTYEFTIELNREDYRGDVFFIPFLVRGEERLTGVANRATKVGARLADGEPWRVTLDRGPDDGGLLQPLVEPFGDHEKFPDDTHMHYLDMDEPRNPQLFLNADHPTIVQVLNNEGSTGGPPRLRDVLFGYIEHGVWMQLLLRTAQDVDEDTAETKFNWQEDVIDLFYEELYPDLDREEATVQLGKDASDVEDLNLLVQRLERAINDRVDLPYDTQRLIEEGIQNVD